MAISRQPSSSLIFPGSSGHRYTTIPILFNLASETIMKKKFALFAAFILIAILIVAGIRYNWNKPPDTVAGKKGLPVTATELCKAFDDNEAAANTRYLNQALDVTGTVLSLERNQDGKQVIMLECSDLTQGVQCTMSNEVAVTTGETITIKGFCNGYTLVVLLSDAILIPTSDPGRNP